MDVIKILGYFFIVIGSVSVVTSLLSTFMALVTTYTLKVLYPQEWAEFKEHVVGPHKYNNPLIFRFSKAYYGQGTIFPSFDSNNFLKWRELFGSFVSFNEKIWKISTTLLIILGVAWFLMFNLSPELLGA